MSDLRISYDDLASCARELQAASGGSASVPVDPSSLGSTVVAAALDDALSLLDWLRDQLATETGTLDESARQAAATLRAQDSGLAAAQR